MSVASNDEGGRPARQDAVEVFDPPNAAPTWDPYAVDALSASAEAHRANGDMTRLSETEAWLALAREDQAAAAAGVDYRDLAAMGPESIMTEPAPCCGYPEAGAGR